ncbi:MAG: hypothetical protein VX252_12230, partial [Myxococcota bacterium]|nr:hypothetical protein [Myxococcota bacterium]
MTTASRAPAKILPLHAVHAEDDTISLRTLPTAITSTLKLAIKLPKQLLSPRFSAFEPRQAIPDLPRSLLIRLKVLLFLYPAFFLFGFDGRFRSMRKSIYADMQEHLEKNALRTSEPDPILEVEHQDLPSHLETFYDHPVPFVVRNYNPDSPAVKKWSLDWLSENYGDFLCSSSDAADHTPRKLSSLLAKDYYINFLDRIFRVHPELEDELEAEEITKQFSEILGIEHTYKEFFASQKSGSGSGLHSHSVWNFFLQVSGKKEWTL